MLRGNLLNRAFRLIPPQVVRYYQALSRTTNSIGQNITTYAMGVDIVGSFQPLSKALYAQFGLDLQKSYYTLYASKDILDLQRDISADQLDFLSKRYQCESNTDWFEYDGWKGVLCVMVQNPLPIYFGFNDGDAPNNNVNFGNGVLGA